MKRRNTMSQILEEVIAANAAYVKNFGNTGQLHPFPARHFAILTCIDARINPAKFAGLNEGEAHVVRNAGGRVTDDAIRSLVISWKLTGTREWFVVHHTDCGTLTYTDEIMRGLLASSLKPATIDDEGWHDSGEGSGSTEGEYITWMGIKGQELETSVIADVRRLRNHPLVPSFITIYGMIFDVKTGRLIDVPEATKIGRGAAAAGT
jgi:carbonic anhydrase